MFEKIKEEEFNLKTQHSIVYEDHTHITDKPLESDYNELNKTELMKKLSNHKYLKKFIRYYLNKHEEIGISYIKLLDLFTNDFGNININFELIDENEKTIMINIILKLIFENLFNLVIYDYINFL